MPNVARKATGKKTRAYKTGQEINERANKISFLSYEFENPCVVEYYRNVIIQNGFFLGEQIQKSNWKLPYIGRQLNCVTYTVHTQRARAIPNTNGNRIMLSELDVIIASIQGFSGDYNIIDCSYNIINAYSVLLLYLI